VAASAVTANLRGVRRLAASPWGLALALTVVAGVVLRLWVYRSVMGTPNSDEAIVGLMARHAIDGELTAFYWGQGYGGPQEALLAVPLFLVFGSSWLALRAVPIVLSGVAALLIWRVGLRTIGARPAAVAGVLFWIWPTYNLIQLTHQLGFYASNVVYCALYLLLALRIVERPDVVRVGLFGLAVGLGFWQTAQIVPIVVPVIAWTIWKQPRCLRYVGVAAALAVVGALPWFYWNITHDWASFDLPGADKTYAHRLRIFLSPLLPMTLGLRLPWSQEPLLPKLLVFLIYAGLLALFVYGAYRARKRPVSLLYLVAAVFPFVYAISPRTFESSDPRYLIVLTPLLALLVAQVATSWSRAVPLLALALAVSVANLHRLEERSLTVAPPVTPRSLTPLIEALDGLGIDHVYSSGGLAYRLDFESDERIVAAKSDFADVKVDGDQATPTTVAYNRYPPYEAAVRRARHAFILDRAIVPTSKIVPELRRLGYREHRVSAYSVFALPPSSS
jgi:4-amino-4-deoxy-L-arabinose transferase-like glycosyltransferase